MAYSNIDKPSKYFNTTAYTGNGSAGRNLTTGTFQPDWIWIKSRTDTDNHRLIDAVRGATIHFECDNTAEEQTSSNVTAFTSTGITLSSNGAVNANAETYVVWSWLGANTTASNTQGSITSTVSANTTSGFSIVSYTGTGSLATVGHGLGVAPKFIIIKNRTATGNAWRCYQANLFASNSASFIDLSSTSGVDSGNSVFNSTAPTSSVFTVNTNTEVNQSGQSIIAYCFAEIKGFSKFGSYTGNGSTDGTFVYTGFKPAWVMVKKTNASGTNWQLIDNKRSDSGGNNIIDKVLSPNASDADYDEGSSAWCGDLLSNGFKWRGNWNALNNSGDTYIYACFAENPFVTSKGLPVTAR